LIPIASRDELLDYIDGWAVGTHATAPGEPGRNRTLLVSSRGSLRSMAKRERATDGYPNRIAPVYGPRHSRRVHLSKTDADGDSTTACGKRFMRYFIIPMQATTCEACRNAMQPHGTRRRYGAGCRCPGCRAAATRYIQRRRAA
jgi:hypothetical protein